MKKSDYCTCIIGPGENKQQKTKQNLEKIWRKKLLKREANSWSIWEVEKEQIKYHINLDYWKELNIFNLTSYLGLHDAQTYTIPLYRICTRGLNKKQKYTILQMYQNTFSGEIVNKHWPEICEFITQTIELYNRWIIRLSCYYKRVIRTRVQCITMYHLFCNALVHGFFPRSFRSIFVYNIIYS